MPVGIQRLNARHQQPNSRVVFIKPLPGPTSAYAQDFLERIAAICHPIMKSHHLSIMTLEEYEPNREFVGRNFNAGEIIQLVLRAPYTGHWLPFRSVQMVMMHELAHCMQMNHSGAFWKVRNLYAGDLRELWGKGYTGDGLWGRGKTVLSAEYESFGNMEGEVMAESLCGGTFRSRRGKKRKRKGGDAIAGASLTYAERQQRRIRRKFGVNGVSLGDDVETRVKLENGKKPKGKPRVAGSARGRELRAAAALARFAGQKDEDVKKEEEQGSDSETESDYEDGGPKQEEARDLDGSRLLDAKGNGMIKVCKDEDRDDIHVKQEMRELQSLDDVAFHPPEPSIPSREADTTPPPRIKTEPLPTTPTPILPPLQKLKPPLPQLPPPNPPALTLPTSSLPQPTINPAPLPPHQTLNNSCPICTTISATSALVCIVCANVLDTSKVPGWHCGSAACERSRYVNASDCGVCGICGGRRV